MVRKKRATPKKPHGVRLNIYLDAENARTAKEFENLSAFFQLSLRMAADIMAWDILHNHDPAVYTTNNKFEDYIKDFNTLNPLDPLTKKRMEQKEWPKNSPKKPEPW